MVHPSNKQVQKAVIHMGKIIRVRREVEKEERSMFCHKCGTQIADGSAFCHKCGTKVFNEENVKYQSDTPLVDEKSLDCQSDASASNKETKVDKLDVTLTDVGPNKVKVIKIVREVAYLGLEEAKDIVDRVAAGNEYTITGIQGTDAQTMKERFTQIGAVVEIEIAANDEAIVGIEDTVSDGAVVEIENTINDEEAGSPEGSDLSKSEKAINNILKKFGDFLGTFIEWHEKFYKKNKALTISLIIAEVALAIFLLYKSWEVLVCILIIAAIVFPFIMKHDFTDKDRQNSKEIITGFGKLAVFVIIALVIIINWNSISNIWKPGAVVRNAYFPTFSEEITIGEAFENVFTDCKWSKYTYNGNEYVSFTGKFKEDGGTIATYQFDFLVRGDSATIDSIYCEGMDVSWMEAVLLTSIYNRNGVSR